MDKSSISHFVTEYSGILNFFLIQPIVSTIWHHINTYVYTCTCTHARITGMLRKPGAICIYGVAQKTGSNFAFAICQCNFDFAVLRCSFTIAVLHSIRSFPEFREQKQSADLQCSFAFSDHLCSFQLLEANAVLHFPEQFSTSNLQATMLQKQLQEDKFQQQSQRQLAESPLHVALCFSKFF